jgi:zinc transporter
MDSKDGLISAYALDGRGGGSELSWQGVKSWNATDGFLWVHLDFTAPQTQQWISGESGVDEVVAEALLADDTRPRTSIMKEGMLVMLRGVNTNPGADPEDMVAIRLWIEDGRIISTRKRRLLSIDDVRRSISQGDSPTTPGELLVMLSEHLVTRMSGIINDIDEEVDRLEDAVVQSESPALRHELAKVRTQVIGLRRYLAPQREAILRLYQDKVRWLSDTDRLRIREISDRIIRYVEDLDSMRDRAAVVQEELAARMAEQMNNRMYMLSVVAAIFLPLGFITGLLGVNVGGIPGSENPFGFEWMLAILVLLVLFQVWIFKRRSWL